MAQSNDLPFDLSLLEGELQQEDAPDPLDLIDDPSFGAANYVPILLCLI